MNRFFISLSHGTERAATLELTELGAKNIKETSSGIWCEHQDPYFYYILALKSRIALRVYIPVLEFEISSQDDFYNKAVNINWSDFMDLRERFSITAHCKSSHFTNNHYLALRTKDAICDYFLSKESRRPSVEKEKPDKVFAVTMNRNKCLISLDVSAYSLHKRAYRTEANIAPLMETVAASLIRLSAWDGVSPFYDLMCGSGTLGIEAGLISASRYPASEIENLSFLKWKNFSNDSYSGIVNDIRRAEKLNANIFFNDIKSKNLEITKQNCRRAKLVNNVSFSVSSILDFKPKSEKGLMILNPPYGERMGDDKKITNLYRHLYTHLKEHFKGFRIGIISSNETHLHELKFKPSKVYNVYNAKLKCRYVIFDLY